MINNLFFKITKQCAPCQILAVCGNIPELGQWNPTLAFQLQQQTPDTWCNRSPLVVQLDRKIQFKIITIKPTGEVEWENLPGDLNRRFKVSRDVLLEMTWNDSKGRKKESETKQSGSRSKETSPDLQRLLKHKPKKMVKSSKEQNFNPFNDAYYSQSEDQYSQQKIIQNQYQQHKFLKSEFSFLLQNQPVYERKNVQNEKRLIVAGFESPFEYYNLLEQICNKWRNNYQRIIWITDSDMLGMEADKENYRNIEFVSIQNSSGAGISQKSILFSKKINQFITSTSKCIILSQQLRSSLLMSLNLKVLYLEQSDQTNNSQISSETLSSLKTFLACDPLFCSYQQFDQKHYESSKTKSNHKLYIIDLDIFLKQNYAKNIEINTQCFTKLKALCNRRDSCIILHSQKSAAQIQKILDRQLCNLKVIVIGSKGLDIWFDGQWVYVKDVFKNTFDTLKKCLKNNFRKHSGQIVEDDELLSYRTYHKPSLPLLSQLQSILNNKTIFKLKHTQSEINVNLTYNSSMSLLKVIQLCYLHQGKFDMVCTFVQNSNKKYLTKQIHEIVRQYPSFFEKNIKQFHINLGQEYFTLATHYILIDQWESINL